MELHEQDTLIIRENPFESDSFDVVWKRREKCTTNDYRSRQKTSSVETKLKSYDHKVGSETKLKDKAIDYSYIDEYCKVSAAASPRDEVSRPRELKTNTTEFGRPKVSFDKFLRHHTGGVECNTVHVTQPAQPRVIRKEHHETTPLRECYSQDDVTLKCCGHDVETLVDYCTCMFCVKGLFYHCVEDQSDSENVVDNPCSCAPVNATCFARWSMLGFLSVFLPCLMCYPIAKGCTGVCKCYKEGERRRKCRHNRTVQNQERERLT